MAKGMSAPSVLRAAISAEVVPATAVVSRRGEGRWTSGELSYVLWVSRTHDENLTWELYVGDTKFGSAMESYGGMSVPIRSEQNSTPWPTQVNESLLGFLQTGIGGARNFVKGRSDLCSLLSSREDVVRGRFFAWLPIANYPSRLVQALVLARDMGDDGTASAVRAAMDQEPITLSNGHKLEILADAKQWAKRYSAALGFDVQI